MLTKVHTTEIHDELHRMLLTAQFGPAQKLKPEDLRKRYNCSANTIREILLRLTAAGLVTFEEQRGFRTREATPERRHDVTKFRILLEQEGAIASMQNGGLEWEAQLAAAHHKLSHIETRVATSGAVEDNMQLWSDAERDFHKTLISACDSALLRETYNRVYDQFRQQMVTQERDFGTNYFRAIISEHQAILDAALARDEPTCREAIYDHLKRNL
ncbi:GntR family transcriptional regulator [Litoreibacter roseus]|uniref:GntR family transcriptional regulator n=2 Tax=Litoreibacter roseus TaxID=2601869 RepID=A0A6N6JI27_9RHOB|nr:GntR family transcriptional regulator [Litoreibacter roseus]